MVCGNLVLKAHLNKIIQIKRGNWGNPEICQALARISQPFADSDIDLLKHVANPVLFFTIVRSPF